MVLALNIVKAQDNAAESLDALSLPSDSSSNSEAIGLPSEKTSALTVNKGNQKNNMKGKDKDGVGAILDFEGEVIEGERRRPDLFLQMSIDNIKFDSLIYNRDDFNDYLEVDRKSRTRFLKMK